MYADSLQATRSIRCTLIKPEPCILNRKARIAVERVCAVMCERIVLSMTWQACALYIHDENKVRKYYMSHCFIFQQSQARTADSVPQSHNEAGPHCQNCEFGTAKPDRTAGTAKPQPQARTVGPGRRAENVSFTTASQNAKPDSTARAARIKVRTALPDPTASITEARPQSQTAEPQPQSQNCGHRETVKLEP